MHVKQSGVALGFVLVGTLAVVLAKELSTEAMAVIIGIVCRIAAGIPTSVLLLVVSTRRERLKIEGAERQEARRNYPPVVVIQGGGPQAGYWPAPEPRPMLNGQFQVVGQDGSVMNG